MTHKNTEYDFKEYKDAVNNGNYDVQFKKSKFIVSIKDSRRLSFHIPGGSIGNRAEFFYGKDLAIQLLTDFDYYNLEKKTTIGYSTLPMRSLNLFIDCFLRILINDDLELIARWFIAGGDKYLKSVRDVDSLFIYSIDLHKYEEGVLYISKKRREMFEQLKSELSVYTRRFKEALTAGKIFHESDLIEICAKIKSILKKYIDDYFLSKHPSKEIRNNNTCTINDLLSTLINDDLELIARWFIFGGDSWLDLHGTKYVDSLFISHIDQHKYKEDNEIVLSKKREMFEELKNELSVYTRRFKEALTKRSVYYNSYLYEICLDIKNILKKYIKDDALVEHPADKIPTFKKRGTIDTYQELYYTCWEQ